jgi:hypothetical protein
MKFIPLALLGALSLSACATLGIGEASSDCIANKAAEVVSGVVANGAPTDLNLQGMAATVAADCGIDITMLVQNAIKTALKAAAAAE